MLLTVLKALVFGFGDGVPGGCWSEDSHRVYLPLVSREWKNGSNSS